MPKRLIVPVVLLVVVAAYWWFRPRHPNLGDVHVGERTATLWSSIAQVRQPLATLRYGEKVALLDRKGEHAYVRTAQGITGWLDAHLLMDPALWQRSAQLVVQARALPVQARGHTKVPSNIRAEPGRAAPRIFQFGRGVPVEVLSRTVGEVPARGEENRPAGRDAPEGGQEPRHEDWFLVRGVAPLGAGAGGPEGAPGKSGESVEIAGWLLARFVEPDLPGPVRDYAASAGMRVLAWFELNRVADEEQGEKPQYLSVGSRGGEGQACDFTLIRVYTWGAKRKRYETAYIESDLCGWLPIRVARSPSGDPEFRFTAINAAEPEKKEERVYRLRQTMVRRVREGEGSVSKSARRSR